MSAAQRYEVVIVKPQIVVFFERDDMVRFEALHGEPSFRETYAAKVSIALLYVDRLLRPCVCASEGVSRRAAAPCPFPLRRRKRAALTDRMRAAAVSA